MAPADPFAWNAVVSAGAEEDFDLGYRTNLDGTLAVLERCLRRHGGVTGDCFGAAIEIALTTGLIAASVP